MSLDWTQIIITALVSLLTGGLGVAAINAFVNRKKLAAETESIAIKSLKDALESQVKLTEDRVAILWDGMTKAEGRLKEVEGQVVCLRDKLKEREIMIDEMKTKNGELQEQVKKLEAENNSLRKRVRDLEAHIKRLQEANDERENGAGC